ncbi:MAG: hypothetical protein BWY59_00794 [Verrucomicrobia bacterium ADurb.Bin345]|nr:MAG: hypothetical protein BWY59_00794 [Verrucomicrobia bacterium ADurb.Bin345]
MPQPRIVADHGDRVFPHLDPILHRRIRMREQRAAHALAHHGGKRPEQSGQQCNHQGNGDQHDRERPPALPPRDQDRRHGQSGHGADPSAPRLCQVHHGKTQHQSIAGQHARRKPRRGQQQQRQAYRHDQLEQVREVVRAEVGSAGPHAVLLRPLQVQHHVGVLAVLDDGIPCDQRHHHDERAEQDSPPAGPVHDVCPRPVRRHVTRNLQQLDGGLVGNRGTKRDQRSVGKQQDPYPTPDRNPERSLFRHGKRAGETHRRADERQEHQGADRPQTHRAEKKYADRRRGQHEKHGGPLEYCAAPGDDRRRMASAMSNSPLLGRTAFVETQN